MTSLTLIRRSLRFHARSHLGVVLGAAIGSAALTGALLVGDSVRESLKRTSLAHLGQIHFALQARDRLFQTNLRARLLDHSEDSSAPASSALVLPGIVVRQDGSARANRVIVIGVENPAWPRLAGWDAGGAVSTNVPSSAGPLAQWNAGETALLNESLAHQLAAQPGDEIIVRVRKPSALGLDAAISPKGEGSVAIRLKVGGILPADRLGNFSLSPQPLPPANLFLPLEFLQKKLALDDRANLMVLGPLVAGNPPRAKPKTPSATGDALALLNQRLRSSWLLEDAQLNVRVLEPPPADTGAILPSIELSSPRIFLEPNVVAAALGPGTNLLANRQSNAANDAAFARIMTNGTPVLTYLANLIRAGDRAAPYSMITAAGPPFTPSDLRDDEILLNEWLADDLKLKSGDSVELSYYVVDSGTRLAERTNSFRVRSVVPIRGRYADRTLMPEFPGVAKAESTHDWDAGFPLTYPIRDKDEAYWKQYRGTPKAFITLAAGQAMWANRFGSLTAVRYPVPSNTVASACREAVYRNLHANLEPSGLGLRFEPVRAQALKAADQSQDFGQLFLGFSIFLVVAALLLMALLFQFGLEQRAAEVGTLLALGFPPKQVRRMFLLEGAALAFAGGLLGVLGGVAYAKGMLWGLTSIWRSAVSGSTLQFYANPTTLIIGLASSTLVAVAVIWLTLRKQARRPARELLAGEGNNLLPTRRSRGLWIGAIAGLGVVGIIGWALLNGQTASPETFFGAGALLLLAGLASASAWFSSLARRAGTTTLTLAGLGVRGCARRRTRSLATVALLASGCFVILAMGVFRLDADRDAAKHSSGTGGFALLGETALPLLHDLNSKSGRESLGLSPADLAGVDAVPLRVHDGDEASCLNLNRAQRPRLLGVKPELLAGRFTFANAAKGLDPKNGWQLLKAAQAASSSANLNPSPSEDEIPAIGDANSIEWALGKKLGDTIDYTDENGRTFKLRLVAAVANSILQGSLIIDESEFVKRFPGESGYRMFLLDVPSTSLARVYATLSRALQDAGLEVTSTIERLNAFNAVQNTYLGTFQILGGLGLLLGSAGLGIVVLRNVLERRGELGLLLAVGFTRRTAQNLVLGEHGALLALGLGIGLVAAGVAVLPNLLSPGRPLPWLSLTLTLGAVLVNALWWTWLAAKYALRGNLLSALRNE